MGHTSLLGKGPLVQISAGFFYLWVALAYHTLRLKFNDSP
jgi:hypothetical protein